MPWYCLAVEFSSLLCLIVPLLFSGLPAPSLGLLLASATVYLSAKKLNITTGDKPYCADSTVPTGFALLSLGFQKRSLEKPWLVLLKSGPKPKSIYVPSPQPVALPPLIARPFSLTRPSRLCPLRSRNPPTSGLPPSLPHPFCCHLERFSLVSSSPLVRSCPYNTGQHRTRRYGTWYHHPTPGALCPSSPFHFISVLYYSTPTLFLFLILDISPRGF